MTNSVQRLNQAVLNMMYHTCYDFCFVMIGLFARKVSLLKVHQSQNEQGRGTSSYIDASTSPDGFGSTSPDGVEVMQSPDVRYLVMNI